MARASSSHRPQYVARQRAVQALYQLQINPDSAQQVITQFLETQDFTNVDEPHFCRLVLQGTQHEKDIAEQLKPHLDIAWDQLDPMEKSVLQIAWVELTQHQEIPFKVVLNEAVDLAKRFGADGSHSFVNAVLDPFSRETRKFEQLAEEQNTAPTSSTG